MSEIGKTTILYKLKLGVVVTTTPTIGFNVEQVVYKNTSMNVWDLGGQTKTRVLWREYFQKTRALIFVVDSNDRGRIGEAAKELSSLLKEESLANVKLLVFANKQDVPEAMSVEEVSEKLGLAGIEDRKHYIQSCSATKGQGIFEGLDWLSKAIKSDTLQKKTI